MTPITRGIRVWRPLTLSAPERVASRSDDFTSPSSSWSGGASSACPFLSSGSSGGGCSTTRGGAGATDLSMRNNTPSVARMYRTGVPHSKVLEREASTALRASATAASTGSSSATAS